MLAARRQLSQSLKSTSTSSLIKYLSTAAGNGSILRASRVGSSSTSLSTRSLHTTPSIFQASEAEPSSEAAEEAFDLNTVERVTDEADVIIVGAGPAGLSAAIKIKQLAEEKGEEVRVVVLEKGGEVGE